MQDIQAHTQQLLQRYVSGAITAPEEAELERLALTDDGLKKAMEGLYQLPETNHEAHITSMVARAKPTAVRRSLFTRYAAAAAVLLLLGLAALLLPTHLGDTEDSMAMEAPVAEQATITIPAATAPSPDSIALARRRPRPTPPPATDVATVESLPPPVVAPLETSEETQAEVRAEETAPDVEYDEAVMTEVAPQAPVPQISDAPVSVIPSRARSLRVAPPPVRGFVGTEDGTPIVGATITRPGLPAEVTTDSAGNFVIAYDATLSELRISYPGFEAEELVLIDPEEPVQISLSEEAKVAPMDRFLEAAARQEIRMEPALKPQGEARPEEGLRALKRRIETGKPAEVPSGKVRVSFLVSPDGSLSDFQFRDGPDRVTMDYVGKALVESSSWNVVSGEEDVRVYLKLRFE